MYVIPHGTATQYPVLPAGQADIQSVFKQSQLKLPVPFTSRAYAGVVVPIPTKPPVRTVSAFKGFQMLPIQISNILFDNHTLYVPITVDPKTYAIV
ncbi:TPA: hypothetical protein DCZ39_07825 [Patescibacteria group bacterium]|nr:hypothetical protein [Candidatus Gracilibacteria bacterium]